MAEAEETKNEDETAIMREWTHSTYRLGPYTADESIALYANGVVPIPFMTQCRLQALRLSCLQVVRSRKGIVEWGEGGLPRFEDGGSEDDGCSSTVVMIVMALLDFGCVVEAGVERGE